jgi:protein phosphatase PTC7
MAQQIEGSSTICIATIDYNLNQLLYSNLGDCGLMVLRHIDSETAGYLRSESHSSSSHLLSDAVAVW